jgi:hypothetical protein
MLIFITKNHHASRDAARETNPKEYDISKSTDKDRNLLRATYKRIGNGNEVNQWNISLSATICRVSL